jgi:hypothetical protein
MLSYDDQTGPKHVVVISLLRVWVCWLYYLSRSISTMAQGTGLYLYRNEVQRCMPNARLGGPHIPEGWGVPTAVLLILYSIVKSLWVNGYGRMQGEVMPLSLGSSSPRRDYDPSKRLKLPSDTL